MVCNLNATIWYGVCCKGVLELAVFVRLQQPNFQREQDNKNMDAELLPAGRELKTDRQQRKK